MKQFYLLLSVLFMSAGLSAQTFVNSAAADGGDGTSWATAYNSFDDALANTASGEIWVAAGTYIPAGDRFEIGTSLTILGGFAGDETSADDRDPLMNFTTFSGDVNGDDVAGDLDSNRMDNKRIMYIDSLIADGVVIDGFVFSGGTTLIDTSSDASGAIADFSGAAIQSFSPVIVENCAFFANFSDFGTLVLLDPGTAGSRVNTCEFAGNFGNNRAPGVYASLTTDVEIDGCFFRDNNGLRGAVYLINVIGITVSNSIFQDNNAIDRGPGLGVVFYDDVLVENCTFDGNTAFDPALGPFNGRGGSIYVAGDANTAGDADNIVFNNCTFTNSESQSIGGVMYALRADFTFNDCTFEDNSSTAQNGYAIFSLNTPENARNTTVTNSVFEDNEGTGSGAFRAQGPHVSNVISTDFIGNNDLGTAGRGAGFSYIAGDVFDFTITDPSVWNFDSCSFVSNTAGLIGGALYGATLSATSELNITNTSFSGNIVGDFGGGAVFVFESDVVTMDNVDAQFNSASAGQGGFLTRIAAEDNPAAGTLNLPTIINNSTFGGNLAQGQGGVISLLDGGDLTVTNTIFYDNLVTEQGSGGAIIANGDSIGQRVTLINNTFVGNSAGTTGAPVFGDDVAVFTADAVPAADATQAFITNNAFLSQGIASGNVALEPEVDVSNATITTLGGNIYVQEPLDFTADAADLFDDGIEAESVLTAYEVGGDPQDLNFKPNLDLDDNPLIDGGVTGDDVPTTDRFGNNRTMVPDVGAVECVQSILDIVVASEVHTTLEDLVIQAGLAETLDTGGPFTLFAPTDDAFAMLSAEELANAQAMLTQTLLTHVISGVTLSGAITNGLVVPSLLDGADLVFVVDAGVTVQTVGSPIATVIIPDLEASNGVVHVIDKVLLSILVSVQNIDESGLDVKFFPNPVQNYMSVQIDDVTTEEVEVSVINMNGQRVNNWVLGNGNNVINFTSLPAGTYTLEVNIDGQLYSKQVVKQ